VNARACTFLRSIIFLVRRFNPSDLRRRDVVAEFGNESTRHSYAARLRVQVLTSIPYLRTARFKGRRENLTGVQKMYIERECKVILSALTSVGYIGYYIVRCILVHGARVQKSGYVSTEGKREGGKKGGKGLNIFYNGPQPRERMVWRGAGEDRLN